ncbi:melanotransferrin [Bombina bombina]|uniref:melanotransferrin n=1 Tax=Bombina bombina TaxID=8345 RepID=UPI00235ABA94|nr:melanotransferrin [Bombina bombina]
MCLSEVRWCTTDPEKQKCNDMKSAFAKAQIVPSLSCVNAASSLDCAKMVMNNRADAVVLDGSLIYQAGKQLKPIVAEVYDQGVGTSYYAVAVVRRNSSITINTLKGTKSCHTGLQRTAGWNVPIGYLIDTGRMSVMKCNIYQAVSKFFSMSCVPGADSTNFPSLCELCKGDENGSNKCKLNDKERYSDYSGAFRCLVEGAGDVAFVKHSTVNDNSDGKNKEVWAQNVLSSDYQLLCQDGTRAEVNEWRQCHLARVPARAVMTRSDVDGSLIYKILNDGQAKFNDDSTDFKMFSSSAYGGSNLLFKDSTIELRPISNQTYQAWLGDDYLQAVKGMDCDPESLPKSLRWCTLSTSEIWKCADMAAAFINKTLYPSLQCVSADKPEACMEMIQKKEIDAVTLNGRDIYTAGNIYGLVPAAGESYSAGDLTSSYYAVAVVYKSNTEAFTIHELKGKKSCHTGYERTAGWNIPIGALIKKGLIRPEGCNIAKAVTNFFSASCVPGGNQKDFPAKLCQLCKGDGSGKNKCALSTQEQYFGYSGAFRCLAEKAGDVAFIKHSTVFENTDGHNSEVWAKDLKSSNFQLLCPNGARAEVDQYASCNWAQVPARAVMVHPDTNKHAVYGLLDNAQEFYANNISSEFRMFDSSAYHSQDLLFKDSTHKIVPVQEKTTYQQWLGKAYFESLEGLNCTSLATAVTPVNTLLLLISNILLIKICA